jgi:hypothetical protein
VVVALVVMFGGLVEVVVMCSGLVVVVVMLVVVAVVVMFSGLVVVVVMFNGGCGGGDVQWVSSGGCDVQCFGQVWVDDAHQFLCQREIRARPV